MEELLKYISRLKAAHVKVLVAIDGYGGSGKSSLAQSLVENFKDARHIEFDWFHHTRAAIYNDDRFDIQRFKEEIVQPFLSDAKELNFKKYNWGYLANRPEGHEGEIIPLEGVSTLIIEGCMTLHPKIVDLFHLKIWVGRDLVASRRQGIRRDIEEYGLLTQTVLRAWKEWGEWEDRCLAQDDRRERADFMI